MSFLYTCCVCKKESHEDDTDYVHEDCLETLKQRVAELEAKNSWQPIETAPKDQVGILGYEKVNDDYWIIVPMYFSDGAWRIIAFNVGNTEYAINPTRWQPLPEPPKEPEP